MRAEVKSGMRGPHSIEDIADLLVDVHCAIRDSGAEDDLLLYAARCAKNARDAIDGALSDLSDTLQDAGLATDAEHGLAERVEQAIRFYRDAHTSCRGR